MQTLKQFLQSLSYKRDITIARNARGLLQGLKSSKVPEKLGFYVITDDDFIDKDHKDHLLRELGYKKAI